MKITVKGEGHYFCIPIPTGLVFSKTVVWLALHAGKRYAAEAMENISPEALEAIFTEFRRVKKKYGSWELVNVESPGGNLVNITL